jgi:hypothetical protein
MKAVINFLKDYGLVILIVIDVIIISQIHKFI